MVSATWRRQGARLVVQPSGLRVTRLLLGLPLLGGGLFFAFLFLTAPIANYRAAGWDGVVEGIAGMLVVAFLGAIILPLGWWIVMLRSRVELDATEVVSVLDWRVGSNRSSRPAGEFGAVRVARESTAEASSSHHTSQASYVNVVRLLAREPKVHPTFEIAFFDDDERRLPLQLGEEVATLLGLELQVDLEEVAAVPWRDFDPDRDDAGNG